MQVLVVFASQTGHTRRMAEAVAEGAREAGARVVLRDAARAADADLRAADAVVLGSGVHMGGVASPMRAFLERSAPQWLEGALVGKLGAAFVSAGAGGRGGAELALLGLLAALAEHGMLLVSMPRRLEGFAEAGSHWGPVARTGAGGPSEAQLEAARAHGRHVAGCADRWRAGAAPPDAR